MNLLLGRGHIACKSWAKKECRLRSITEAEDWSFYEVILADPQYINFALVPENLSNLANREVTPICKGC